METKNIFTFTLDDVQQDKMLIVLGGGNYRLREVPYSQISVEGDGFNCTLYNAKMKHGKSVAKACVQGRKAQEFVQFVLEPYGVVPVEVGYEDVVDPSQLEAHAGSDESGKGDFFGPLVVCCVYTDEKLTPKLREAGAGDCKQMSDGQVLTIGRNLREVLGPERFALVRFNPAAYNRTYSKMRNINRMLAWAHGQALENLLEKQPHCRRCVIDQFARTEDTIKRALKERGKKIEIVQRHKAESDIAVAAASVIAREVFLRSLCDIAREIDPETEKPFEAIPKGSSDPRVRKIAEDMVRKNGPVWLMNHCKAHFQTTDKVLEACGSSRAALPPEGQVTSAVKNGDYKNA
jgi:ribonuclease HIII